MIQKAFEIILILEVKLHIEFSFKKPFTIWVRLENIKHVTDLWNSSTYSKIKLIYNKQDLKHVLEKEHKEIVY